MDNATIVLIVLAALAVMMAIFLFATARRRDTSRALRSTAPDTPPATGDDADRLPVPVGASQTQTGREIERAVALERTGRGAPDVSIAPPPPALPPDEESLGVTRRQVLNRGIVVTMLLAISGFGAGMVAMLWPSLSGGFGAKIRAGKVEEVLDAINTKKEPFYVGAGRFYIQPYPKEAVGAAKKVASYGAVVEGYDQGFVALYQKCVHLGCRVPWCKTSQWFECPCHGSQYNRVGEKKGGPAPRGLDRFVVSVDGGSVVVDTKMVIPGPPIGTNTTGQEAEGPHCIGAVGGH
ncbi:MAG: cytochrome b6-f complex iron-sulfur subunit [Actinomycetota bacterium]|nr:cytochrome b6-f complex iron-sulfur subunit [Actinomycetota bacterium]